jgi:hypothetical protein
MIRRGHRGGVLQADPHMDVTSDFELGSSVSNKLAVTSDLISS